MTAETMAVSPGRSDAAPLVVRPILLTTKTKSMPSRNSSHLQTTSRFGEQLAGWKSEVENFFQNDWSRLRTLIMQLEEQSWCDESHLESDRSTPPEHTILPAPVPVSGPAALSEAPRPADDRLSDLAARIEQQLRVTHKSGR